MGTYDDKLLNAVSNFPVIFNHMMSDYKNADAKAKAWEDVQRMMDTNEPIEKIRQRWKSIRDSYVKYLNKKDKSGNVSRVRPYKFEKQLKFLKPFLSTQRENNSQHSNIADIEIESADQILSVSQYADDGQSSNSSISSRKRKRNDLNVFEDSINTINSMPMINHGYRMIQQNDDVDSFFHGLAQTMKKLRPLTVAKLKKEIANMVTDAEIRELEEADKYALTENGY